MTDLLFGPWAPDESGLNTRDQSNALLLATCQNVYPNIPGRGYSPIPSLAVFQTGAGLPAPCVGAFTARTSSGAYVMFAGTATGLYKYNASTSAWDSYTRLVGGAYSVPIGDYWSWTQFGSKVIACNFNDNPQTIDVDTGAVNFTDLGGSPPKARYVGAVGDFVFLACLSSNPRMVMNGAFDSTTGWTLGTNLCDQQELPDGDRITGFSGGEFGYVMQEHAIRRAIFQPGYDQAFRFERVERERGAAGNYSAVGVRDTIYFYSSDGFYSYGPQGLRPIGHHRVNNWWTAHSDTNRIGSIYGFSDQTGPRIFWCGFASSTSTILDVGLIYDWDIDQWSSTNQAAQFFGRGATAGTTLEALDVYGNIDSGLIPYPFDSPIWQGGLPVILAINSSGKLCFLNGTNPQNAQIVTAPIQLNAGARTVMEDFQPLGVFNNGAVTMRVGRQERTQDLPSYTALLSPSTLTGIIRQRAAARIHAIEMNISQSSGTLWEHAIGVNVRVDNGGDR